MFKKIHINYLPLWTVGLVIIGLSFTNCGDEAQLEISYSRDIQPIFQYNCTSCHGNESPSASLSLTSYDSLMAGSNRGPVVKPESKPKYSTLYKKVALNDEELSYGNRMPPGGPYLEEQEIDLIWQWIYDGAPDN